MISSWSVAGGFSLSVYSSSILVDSKLTLICLLTQQQLVTASARNTQDIILI